ncbi:MAG: hypothetical protein IKW09_00695 [Alphaproteobacteria bacterium]|nr:hypothetical protein [Alphaproteobacteria bacterium]
MSNLNVGLSLAMFVGTTYAATYNCGYNCKTHPDSDYVYFESGNGYGYTCGGLANATSPEVIYVSHGETLETTTSSALYYCCDNGFGADGYWIEFPYGSIPSGNSCANTYTWISLGSNKYCQATYTGTWEWCAGHRSSGILYFADGGECVYTSGTCSTFTHCGLGYYKNGSVCTKCPNGGTTSGYTNTGISACYLPTGTSMSDTSGTYTCSSNAYYVN